MKTLKLLNYAADRWVAGDGSLAGVESAVTGETFALTGSAGLGFARQRSSTSLGPNGGSVVQLLPAPRHHPRAPAAR